MTIYQVGEGQEFGTLRAAAEKVEPGDTVLILAGVYREALELNTPGVAWQAAEPRAAIIDGGWDGKTVQTGFDTQVSIQAENVALHGVVIRNCKGRGLGVSASHVTVRNCRIDTTFHGAILLTGGSGLKQGIEDVTIEDCDIANTSLSWLVEERPENVNGCINIHNVRNSAFRRNRISDGWGEGINIARGSSGVLIEGNTVHSMNHVLMYFMRCQNCEARGNWLYHIPDPTYASKGGEYSAAVVFGDERGRINAQWPPQEGNRLIGNVIVGAGKLLQVRNNANETGGYDTQLLDTEIAGNTFVAGPGTTEGIVINPNQRGRPHRNSVFRDNVIDFRNAAPGADVATFGAGGGVEFHHNAWTEKPPETMQGAGDMVRPDLGLAEPGAAIARNGAPPSTDFDAGHYRPRPDSPLIGAASDGTTIGALEPVTVEPPEPPPPDEPDPAFDDIEQTMTLCMANLTQLSVNMARLARLIDDYKRGEPVE